METGNIIMLIGGFLVSLSDTKLTCGRFVDRDMFMRYHGGGVGHCRSTGAVTLNEADDVDALIPAIAEERRENDGEPFEAQGGEDRETDSESPESSDSDETGSLFEDDEGMDSCDVD
jgi:hypothetical protein